MNISFYPASYEIKHWDHDLSHLIFSLKYDGINLEVIAGFFQKIDRAAFEKELEQALIERPSSKYLRKIWFLYEWMTGAKLGVADLRKGNYVDLLEEDRYYTGRSWDSRRHRIRVNCLGNKDFCPTIRRTKNLEGRDATQIKKTIEDTIQQYGQDLIFRAALYLYTKETRASFEIERERPSSAKAERFVSLLRESEKLVEIDKAILLQLQKLTVDPRYAAEDYREEQVYIGESIDYTRQLVHYAAPTAIDVPALMDGWFACYRNLLSSQIDPIVAAACLSFGFVFIHPFPDGNGRLHRFLIHHLLSRMGVVPKGFIVPVSAVMLNKRREYDACLESFSRPLMKKLDYEMNEKGEMRMVEPEKSLRFYQYTDMTKMAESLYAWILEAVEKEMLQELQFLSAYREIKKEIQEIVDMPNQRLDLLIQLMMQNNGTLSKKKRELFSELRQEELLQMEEAVNRHLTALGKGRG
jgi:hypothetical protein